MLKPLSKSFTLIPETPLESQGGKKNVKEKGKTSLVVRYCYTDAASSIVFMLKSEPLGIIIGKMLTYKRPPSIKIDAQIP
jgi:hypothetical protein